MTVMDKVSNLLWLLKINVWILPYKITDDSE